MAHIPINHHLRPVYRGIAALTGLYLTVFGVLGYAESSSLDFFAHEGMKQVLGMKANPAFSVLSVVLGLVTLVGAVVGRNIDHYLNLWVSGALMLVGTAMLALLRTELNVFGFSMVNVIVVYTASMLLMAAGLYGRVGTPEQADVEDKFRHAHSH